jgi:hypothetical protein
MYIVPTKHNIVNTFPNLFLFVLNELCAIGATLGATPISANIGKYRQ